MALTYSGTRDRSIMATASEAILRGICPDGGLYIPEEIPIMEKSLEELGKGLRSQVGTMFATKEKGPRYLEMAEGYCSRLALNKDDEIIGYEFISLGKMMDFIKKGDDANEALKKATGHYGQWDSAVKYIDPRHE